MIEIVLQAVKHCNEELGSKKQNFRFLSVALRGYSLLKGGTERNYISFLYVTNKLGRFKRENIEHCMNLISKVMLCKPF